MKKIIHLQRGVASVEFGLVFLAIFLALYGFATFAAVFYVQQALSRAAEDGARAVSQLPSDVTIDDSRIVSVVYDSLSNSLITPPASVFNRSKRKEWITSTVTARVAILGGSSLDKSAKISISYPYSENRLIPSLALLDASTWMPDTLTSHAVAAIPR